MKRMSEFAEFIENLMNWGGVKKEVVLLISSAIFLICSFFRIEFLGFDFAWLVVALCGIPIILEATISLVTRFDIKADVLVAIAIVASVFIGELFAAGEVAFIMKLGELLEELSTRRARAEFERLASRAPLRARRLDRYGNAETIAATEVQVGDRLRILPGDLVPVDGRVISGETMIDEQSLTGESFPSEKSVDDLVLSGSLNLFGSFDMTAEKVDRDSTIQRVLQIVETIEVDDSRVVRLADRMATWLVIGALAVAAITFGLGLGARRAATVLIVFCPCAFVLATPTALVAALGNASRRGFLLKSADTLERIAKVNLIAFDKTGVLTEGKIVVCDVVCVSEEFSKDQIIDWVTRVEALSEHPLGRAIAAMRPIQDGSGDPPERFCARPGRGVGATVGGRSIVIGCFSFLKESGVADVDRFSSRAEATSSEKGVVFVAVDGKTAGWFVVSDVVRQGSQKMIGFLKGIGMRVSLLSGDSARIVDSVGGKMGFDETLGGLLPEDKERVVVGFQQAGKIVCMVGDGVNDAPALKRADVGIGVGSMASDIALAASDVALINDDVEALPVLFALAKRVSNTIKTNLFLSLTINIIAILLAVFGALSPAAGALVHNASSLIVVLNSSALASSRRRSVV